MKGDMERSVGRELTLISHRHQGEWAIFGKERGWVHGRPIRAPVRSRLGSTDRMRIGHAACGPADVADMRSADQEGSSVVCAAIVARWRMVPWTPGNKVWGSAWPSRSLTRRMGTRVVAEGTRSFYRAENGCGIQSAMWKSGCARHGFSRGRAGRPEEGLVRHSRWRCTAVTQALAVHGCARLCGGAHSSRLCGGHHCGLGQPCREVHSCAQPTSLGERNGCAAILRVRRL
jgi:hypothetical protein